MKEIVILSGKGGTGKSSVCSALAHIKKDNILVADCDVDAADLHLIMAPENVPGVDFYSGIIAEIDAEKCIACGLCAQKCRFDAISLYEGKYRVEPLDCEGCAYCHYICPVEAIAIPQQNIGNYFQAESRLGFTLVHARLNIGAENSGKLVAKVKSIAKEQCKKEGKDFMLVDGSPGIGCPVISSLSGVDYVVLVTEATYSGLSDLERLWTLLDMFKLPGACIINKADINPSVASEIRKFMQKKKIADLGDIPYSEDFPKAIAMGRTLIEENETRWRPVFEKIWKAIEEKI